MAFSHKEKGRRIRAAQGEGTTTTRQHDSTPIDLATIDPARDVARDLLDEIGAPIPPYQSLAHWRRSYGEQAVRDAIMRLNFRNEPPTPFAIAAELRSGRRVPFLFARSA